MTPTRHLALTVAICYMQTHSLVSHFRNDLKSRTSILCLKVASVE